MILSAGALEPQTFRLPLLISKGMGDARAQLLLETLARHWGHGQFRGYQLEAISAVMNERRDCFLMMATGSGKSLTFQLPVVMLCNLGAYCCSIVISPLVSLMEDQVSSLQAMGIAACALGATSDSKIEEQAMRGGYALVYCTPEKAMMWKHGLAALAQVRKIVCLAIDESHCVSEWGHDFRPEYRQLGQLRDVLGRDVPVIALTASATLQTQSDVIESLSLRSPLVIRGSLHRPNLFYSAAHKSSTNDVLHRLVAFRQAQLQGMGINSLADGRHVPYLTSLIYVNSKKLCETIAHEIVGCRSLQGIKVAFYHASMPMEDRSFVLQAFLRDDIQVIVATTAFGMGINKPDIRICIHYGLPLSMEGYYQQTGRAGRDGERADCVLLWNRQDVLSCYSLATTAVRSGSGSCGGAEDPFVPFAQSDELPASERTAKNRILCMVNYAQGEGNCRRAHMLSYFQEPYDPSAVPEQSSWQCCDLCRAGLEAKTRVARIAGNGGTIIPRTSTLSSLSPQVLAPSSSAGLLDLSKEVYLLLRAVQECGGHFGLTVPLSVLMGKNDKNVQRCRDYAQMECYGTGAGRSMDWWKALALELTEVEELLDAQLVKRSDSAFSYQRYYVSKKGRDYLQGKRGADTDGPAPVALAGRRGPDHLQEATAITVDELFAFDNADTLPPEHSLPMSRASPPKSSISAGSSLWAFAVDPQQFVPPVVEADVLSIEVQRLPFSEEAHRFWLQPRVEFRRVHAAEERKECRAASNEEAAQRARQVLYQSIEEESAVLRQRLVRSQSLALEVPDSSTAQLCLPRSQSLTSQSTNAAINLRLSIEAAIRAARNELSKQLRINPYVVVSTAEIQSLVGLVEAGAREISVSEVMTTLGWLPWKLPIATEIASCISTIAQASSVTTGVNQQLLSIPVDSSAHCAARTSITNAAIRDRNPAMKKQKSMLYRPNYSEEVALEVKSESERTQSEAPAQREDAGAGGSVDALFPCTVSVPVDNSDVVLPSTAGIAGEAAKAVKKRALMGGLGGLKMRKLS